LTVTERFCFVNAWMAASSKFVWNVEPDPLSVALDKPPLVGDDDEPLEHALTATLRAAAHAAAMAAERRTEGEGLMVTVAP
jgi:hypothetical protein